MRDLLRIAAVRNLRAQPLRSALTTIGTACGVALFVAIEIINASTLRYFGDGVRAMAGGAALTLSAGQAGFARGVLEKVSTIPGVHAAVPSIEAVAHTVPRHETEPGLLAVLGVDPVLEPLARTHRAEGAPGPVSLKALGPDAILLPSTYAAGAPASQRDWINVIGQSGVQRLQVDGRLAATAGGTGGLALVSLETAQRLFGFEGRITRIDVLADAGQDIEVLASAVSRALGPAFRVESSRGREADMQRMVRGYQVALRFLGIVALIAGAVAVGATITLSVNEQAKSIGILRALGGARSTVLLLVVAEAALLAAIAVALGLFAGRMGAEMLVGAVSTALANAYLVPIQPSTLDYPASVAALHATFAWIVVVATALAAAADAARTQPAAAMGRPEIGTAPGIPRWLNVLGIAGASLAVLLGLAAGSGLERQQQQWQTANAILGTGAAIALAPAGVIAALSLAQRTRFGRAMIDRAVLLRLAIGTVLRTPGRSAWRVLILSIGLMTFVAASAVHDSLLAGIEGWFDRTLYSDLLVASPGRLFLMEVQPQNEALAREIDAVPGVRVDDGRGAMGIRYATIRHGGRDVTVKAFDPPHASLQRLPFDFRNDYPVARGGDIFASPRPTALVSENFAKHFGKGTGDELALDSPAGPLRAEILGVVTDFASPTGVVYLPRNLYRAHWNDPLVSVFSVMVQPGADPAAVAEAIEARLESTVIRATNGRELRRQTREVLKESFAYSHAIEGAVLIAAVLAIMNSLTASVFARQRELSVLRALGMSRRAMIGMVLLEGLCLGIPSAVAAAALGSMLGYLFLAGVLSAMMGWTLDFHASAWTVGWTLLIGAASGAAASTLAAWRSANTNVTDGLAAG